MPLERFSIILDFDYRRLISARAPAEIESFSIYRLLHILQT